MARVESLRLWLPRIGVTWLRRVRVSRVRVARFGSVRRPRIGIARLAALVAPALLLAAQSRVHLSEHAGDLLP